MELTDFGNINSTIKRIDNNVIEIENIPSDPRTKNNLFDVMVCAYYGQGQHKSGVERGSDYLCKNVKECFNINKYCLVSPDTKEVSTGNNWQKDYKKLYDYLKQQKSYILIGGDHSIGMSSVASSIYKTSDVNNLYVLWIDAHADTNTMEASITKNIHGQPLASIMGYENPWFPIKETLPATNLLYFGIRDLDDYEKEMINKNNIFNTSDLQKMLSKIDDIIKNNSDAIFHISFDVDALDSTIMDSTGCVVNDGLLTVDVSSVVNYVKSRLMAFDLVEFNPDLGNKDKSLETINQILNGIKQ